MSHNHLYTVIKACDILDDKLPSVLLINAFLSFYDSYFLAFLRRALRYLSPQNKNFGHRFTGKCLKIRINIYSESLSAKSALNLI